MELSSFPYVFYFLDLSYLLFIYYFYCQHFSLFLLISFILSWEILFTYFIDISFLNHLLILQADANPDINPDSPFNVNYLFPSINSPLSSNLNSTFIPSYDISNVPTINLSPSDSNVPNISDLPEPSSGNQSGIPSAYSSIPSAHGSIPSGHESIPSGRGSLIIHL